MSNITHLPHDEQELHIVMRPRTSKHSPTLMTARRRDEEDKERRPHANLYWDPRRRDESLTEVLHINVRTNSSQRKLDHKFIKFPNDFSKIIEANWPYMYI